MGKKIKSYLSNLNQNHYAWVFLIATIFGAWLLISTPEAISNLKEILCLGLVRVGIFFVVFFTFMKFLCGFDIDPIAEMLGDSPNKAMAIFLFGVAMSIALLLK